MKVADLEFGAGDGIAGLQELARLVDIDGVDLEFQRLRLLRVAIVGVEEQAERLLDELLQPQLGPVGGMGAFVLGIGVRLSIRPGW